MKAKNTNFSLLIALILSIALIMLLYKAYHGTYYNKTGSGQVCMALTDEEVAQKCKGKTGKELAQCIIECTTKSPVYNDENIND